MILSLQTDTFGSLGGIPTYNRLVCRALDDPESSDPNIVLIAMDDQEDVDRNVSTHPNVRLHAFGGSRIQFVIATIKAALSGKVELILSGHLNYAPLCLLLRFLRPRLRFGVIIYGIEVWNTIPFIRRWALERADFVISISDYTRKQALKFSTLDEKRIYILPNASEWETIEPSKTAVLDLPPGPKLLSVGRLAVTEQQKGFDNVIRCLPAIAHSVPDVEYTIVGSGTDLERHKQIAEESGVSDRVNFLGTVDDQTLRDCYESCDIFAMPSAQEGFGFVYLEAMHYGKPVVAARSGGAPEVVEDQVTGRLVEYGNQSELTQTLVELCLDPEMRARLGSGGRQRLQERFTFNHFKEKLVEILATEMPARRSAGAAAPIAESSPETS